jgi:drug/metabolite transporter (DMT)-like permease
MVDLVLGILAAFGASTLYSLGVALQATEAKRSPKADHLRMSLFRALVTRVRWLAGTALSILGWPLQIVALLLAPLVVVQPALAAGLLVLMFVAERMLHERPGRREYIAMAAIIGGVLGLAATAPARSGSHASNLTLTLVLVGLGLATLLPYLLQYLGRPLASVTMIGAGLGFAWSGLATALAAQDLQQHRLGVALAWGLSTAGASAIGALSEMSALQSRPAIQVAPVVFVTQTVVPVALAPLLLGEDFSTTPLGGLPLLLSLAVVLAGAVMLARSPLLLALMAPGRVEEPVSEASGSGPSRSSPSQPTIRSSPRTEESEPSSVTTTTSPARIGR